MTNHRTLISLSIILAFAVAELLFGRFRLRGVSKRDSRLDFAFFLQSTAVIGPIVAYGLAAIETRLLPGAAGSLAATPWWLQFVVFLLLEDMVQYWYHRSAHTFPALWPMHLAHHTTPYMGARMVYRNGFFYTLLFPNVWIAGVLVYLGFGDVYFVYSIIKAVVTTAAHSELRWDEWLYRYRPLRPLAWVLERTISTPATHFAHHASIEGDGVGHHSGNFGNLLFFWDVLYGSALISRQYPPRFGLDPALPDAKTPWPALMFYPLVRQRAAPVGVSADVPQPAR